MKFFLRQSEREIYEVQESIQRRYAAHFNTNPVSIRSKSIISPGDTIMFNSYGVYGRLKQDIHDMLAASLKENTGALGEFQKNKEDIAGQITNELIKIPLRRYGAKDYTTPTEVAKGAVTLAPFTLGTSLVIEPVRVGIYGRFEKWRKIGVPDTGTPENQKAIREAVEDAFKENALPPREKAIHLVQKSIRKEFRDHYKQNPTAITNAEGLLSKGKEIRPKEYDIVGRAWERIYKETDAFLKKNPDIVETINNNPQVRTRIAKQVVLGEVGGERQREGLIDIGLRRFGGRDKYTLGQRLRGGRAPVLSHLSKAAEGKMEKWRDVAVPDYVDNRDRYKEIIQDALIDNTLGEDSLTRIARDTTRTVNAIKGQVQTKYAERVEGATIDGRALQRIETEIRGFVGRNLDESKVLVRDEREREPVADALVAALVQVPRKTHTWLGRSKTVPDYAGHKEQYVQAVKDVLIDRYLPEEHPERVARDTERALRDLQKAVQDTFKAHPREESSVILSSKGTPVAPTSYEIQGRALDRVYEDSKTFLSNHPERLEAFIGAKNDIVTRLVTDIDALPRKILDTTDLYTASERAKGSGLLQSESTIAVPAYEENKAAFKDVISNALIDNVLEEGHETRVARDTERALRALQKAVQEQFQNSPREAASLVNSKGEEVTPSSYDIQGRALERIYTDSKEFLNRHPDKLAGFIAHKDKIAKAMRAELSVLPLKLVDATDLYTATERMKGNGLRQSESTIAVPAYEENKAAFQGAISSALTGLLHPEHPERVRSVRDAAIRALQTTVTAGFSAEMTAKAQSLEFIGRESKNFLIRNPNALVAFGAKRDEIATRLGAEGYSPENLRDALIDLTLSPTADERLQRDRERNIAALQQAIQGKVDDHYSSEPIKDSKGQVINGATSVKIVGRALAHLHDDTQTFLRDHRIDLNVFKGKETVIAEQVAAEIVKLPIKKQSLTDHSKVALVGSFVDRVTGARPQGVAAGKDSAVIDYDANKGAFKEALKNALIDNLLPADHKARTGRDEARRAESASLETANAGRQTFVGQLFAAAAQVAGRGTGGKN